MEEPEVVMADLLRTLYRLDIYTDMEQLEHIIDQLMIRLITRSHLEK
jgi:hypothetical protein